MPVSRNFSLGFLACLLSIALVLAGCGGGGGGASDINNGGNEFVQDNQNITFNRQVKQTPDGSTVIVAREFTKYSGSAELQSVLATFNAGGQYTGEIRVPRNPWAIAVASNDTVYVGSDNGMIGKVSLTQRKLVQFATGYGAVRDIVLNQDASILYVANAAGTVSIVKNIQNASETVSFSARIQATISSARFVSLRYDSVSNRVVASDLGGRIFLLDAATDTWVPQASPNTPVGLLTQATPDSPLRYQISQPPSRPFEAFDPIIAVNSIRVGTVTAQSGATISLDHDGNGATPPEEYSWRLENSTGIITFFRGNATTAGREITSPMVEAGRTIRPGDIRVDIGLVERFYVGNRFSVLSAEVVRANGTDWLVMMGENIATGTGPIDEPGALDRDNQLQIYQLSGTPYTMPLALAQGCAPTSCRTVLQSPRSMRLVMNPAGTDALIAVANFESNALSLFRYAFTPDAGAFVGPDQDANGADPIHLGTNARGLWDVWFSSDRTVVYTSNLLSQELKPIPIPNTIVQGFRP